MMAKDYLNDELSAIKLAIGMEVDVRKFYLDHVKEMKSELAKKTLVFLADEELKHQEVIEQFLKSLSANEKPAIDSGTDDEADNRSRDFFKTNLGEAMDKAKASAKEIHVYEMGLGLEQKGYDFYKKSALKAEHPNIRALFNFLVKEEEAHYHLLYNAINYLKNPENWFQDEENWFFEG